ncbi:hypothetical protein QN386_24355, partial [Pseudomonas sp. CCI3.2]
DVYKRQAQISGTYKQLQIIKTQHKARIINKLLKETAVLAGFIFRGNSQSFAPSLSSAAQRPF